MPPNFVPGERPGPAPTPAPSMPHEEPDGVVTPIMFNQTLLQALGLGQLKHVVGLSITSGTVAEFPTVHVDLLVTKRGMQAVEAFIRSQRYALVPLPPDVERPIDAKGAVVDWSAASTPRRFPG